MHTDVLHHFVPGRSHYVSNFCLLSGLHTGTEQTENQRREIESAGFNVKPQRIIEEQISGSVAARERPGFNRLLDRLESGDVLRVAQNWIALVVMQWISGKQWSNWQKYRPGALPGIGAC